MSQEYSRGDEIAGEATEKYPSIMASLLYGTCDPERVTCEVVQYAAGDRDLAYYEASLRRVLPMLVSAKRWRVEAADLGELGGVMYNINGAACQYYIDSGRWPSADLLLRVVLLSQFYYREEDFDPSLALGRLGYYACVEDRKDVAQMLVAATFDYMLAYAWCFLPAALCAHVGLCAQSDMASLAQTAVALKAEAEDSWDRVAVWYTHRDEDMAWLRKDWASFREYHSPSPFTEVLFQQVEDEWNKAMSFISTFLPAGPVNRRALRR